MSTSYTLNIQVDGGNISADHSLLTADSVEYIVALFNFDKSWDELYKTAVFRVGELVYHVPLEKQSCKIPFEALKEPIMYISVFGVLGTTRATTTELPIQIQNSGYTKCEPQAPTPDPYNYFLEEINKLKDEIVAYSGFCNEVLNSVNFDKNTISQMLEKVKAESENALAYCEHAAQCAKQSTDTLNEIENNKKAISSLSIEVESNATVAFDAAGRAESAIMIAIENHNYEGNDSAHPNILKIANDAKSNLSNYYTKAEIDAMLANAVFKEE